MINSYPSYKDCGVEWIGEIPNKWTKSRIRMVGYLYGGLTGKKGEDFNNDDNPLNKPFIPFTNIFNNTYISKEHFQYVSVGEEENQNRVVKNDLLFLMSSESYEDLGKCSILLDEIDELYLNSFCKGFRIKDKRLYPRFLNYQLLGSFHKEMISIEGNGFTRINLRQDRLLDIPVFVPSTQEQTQIVSFLDTKTQKIDELIEKTEQKIELLKGKRTSIINHCVTKGLNPNVEMKDSGVEWIGEIPSHWEVKPIKHISGYNQDSLGSDTPSDYELDYLEISDVNSVGEIGNPTHYTFSKSPSRCRRILKKNDIIISTVRTYLRSIGFIENEVQNLICSTGFCVLSPNDIIKPKLLFYLVRSEWFISKVISKSVGVSYPGIQTEKLMSIKVLLPDRNEQTQIVSFLDTKTQKIDELIEKEIQRIELLKEYRQSLISEVATGKIDVRGWKV